MKISLNTAQHFSNVDLKSIDRTLLIDKIGAQLGAVEEVVDWAPKYDKVVVVRVVTCVKHPNADKLSLCTIDDGGVVTDVERDENGYVQVVCGAPNVREDILVAWLPPGSTVPASASTNEPFVLSARELRGFVSNGMLASPKELDITDSHEGILEIDPQNVGEDLAKPGTAFVKLFGLDDVIIDVENKMFTHRPDCFGVLGVARELAGINGLSFSSPDWYRQQPEFSSVDRLPLEVEVTCQDLVPRFMAVALDNIKVGPSPTWLQAGLARVGIKSINNVVDVTNFVMYVTGQPTHAYDYDKIKARSDGTPKLIARSSDKKDSVKLLNGKTATFDTESHTDIVIATDAEVVGVGGVMGGADTEVDAQTTSIILEAATFDMYSVRRTSMKHGLFTEAVTRFNKGQSPWQNDRVVAFAIDQLAQLAGAQQASNVIDIKTRFAANPTLHIDPAFINERLGLELHIDDMAALLKNVEFDVSTDSGKLDVNAPFWRTDIEIPEDIVEEIGRLYGYDQLPLELPRRGIAPAIRNPLVDLKNRIRTSLSRAGANEVMTYSFVHGNLLQKVGQDAEQAYKISNALSPDLQYYRLSLTPSLLDKVHANVRAGYDEFALYELGKAHHTGMVDEDNLPRGLERVALVYAADAKRAKAKSGAAYYYAKLYLETLLNDMGLSTDVSLRPIEEVDLSAYPAIAQMCLPYEPKRAAVLWNGDMVVGVVGEYRAAVKKALKLPDYCAGFETFHRFYALTPTDRYTALPRFPKIEQDICLKVDDALTYHELFNFVWKSIETHKSPETLATLTPVDIYQKDSDQAHKQITFRLTIASYERTMTDVEVSGVLDKVAAEAGAAYGAQRI